MYIINLYLYIKLSYLFIKIFYINIIIYIFFRNLCIISSLDYLTRVLCVSRSSATMRKFRLTTTGRVRARRPTLRVRVIPTMPIKLAKTRK